MAKTRARSSKEAYSKKNVDIPNIIDKKKGISINKIRIRSAKETLHNRSNSKQLEKYELSRNIIDATKSLRRAKAMAIIKTSELQKPRIRHQCMTPNTIRENQIVSSNWKQEKKITFNVPSDKGHKNTDKGSTSAIISSQESPSIRITRSSISSPSISSGKVDTDTIVKLSLKRQEEHRSPTMSTNKGSTKVAKKPTSDLKIILQSSSNRHSRVASLNAKAKVRLLYDDGHIQNKHQSPTLVPKVDHEPAASSSSINSVGEQSDKHPKKSARDLRPLPVRSANKSTKHQSVRFSKLKNELIPLRIPKIKRISHDNIEIIDTKRCKRQANLNASALMTATCTSDYIISSNGPPAALLRQESALKNLKEKKVIQSETTSNTLDNSDQTKNIGSVDSKKITPSKTSLTCNTPVNESSPNEGTSKFCRVKTYSKKDLSHSKTCRQVEKKQEKKPTNESFNGGQRCSISDAWAITLNEQSSTGSADLISDPIAAIDESVGSSVCVPRVKYSQVRINTTDNTRSKNTNSSSSADNVQKVIHSKEKRVKIHRTKAITSQSYRVEMQTTVSQPLSTFITSGHGTSSVFSDQDLGTSCGGQIKEGQICHRNSNQATHSEPQHTHNTLQVSPGMSSGSSRIYTGRSPVYNSSSTQIQDMYSQEPSTSMSSNNSSSLSRSLQHMNQSQVHNLGETYIDSSLNNDSISMIDVANSSSQQHQNAFIIPSATPLQSSPSSLLSPSPSSPFVYGFYHQQNSPGRHQRTTNQYSNQQFIPTTKQQKTTGWSSTYQTHPSQSQNHMSSSGNLHMKSLPVTGELFCESNRTFDQYTNAYNQSFSTNDPSMLCTNSTSMRSMDQSQSQYPTTMERQQSNSSFYSFDNSANQRTLVQPHMSRNSNKNATYQITGPSPDQSQTYQDTYMQTLTVPPLIGISGQPYLIVHPRSNEVTFPMATDTQSKVQESYCNPHGLIIPSVTSSVRSVSDKCSLIGDPASNQPSKKSTSKSQAINAAKKSSKSDSTIQHERRSTKQIASSSPRNSRERNSTRPCQSATNPSENMGLLAVAPYINRTAEPKTDSNMMRAGEVLSTQSASSSTPLINNTRTKPNNSPTSTKFHGGVSVASVVVSQNQQTGTNSSNASSPSESSDPSIRKAQRKIIKKRPLEGLWTLQGTSEEKLVNLTNDSTPQKLLCYPAIKHIEGDIIKTKDSVLLRSGARKTDLPFIAKITNFWKDPNDGIMMSLLWYYRPEHTEEGRKPHHLPDELFASRHRDINSVACIEDKCYVLTFNEYCRYRKRLKMEQYGVTRSLMDYFVAPPKSNPRKDRIPKADVNPELVFCCRQIYDSKQKRTIKNNLINSKYGNHT